MPVGREYLKDHIEEMPQVKQVSPTAHGLLVVQEPGKSGDTFGGMLQSKGWALDFISADRSKLHFVKLEESMLNGGEN